MRTGSTARLSALAGLVVVLIGVAAWVVPWLVRSRPVTTASPSPGPRPPHAGVDVVLRPGGQACVGQVRLDPQTAQLQFTVQGGPTSRLVIAASAPGYHQRATVTVPGSRRPRRASGRIRPPARDVVGSVCASNHGIAPIALLGTNEAPAIGISQTSVDGHPLGQTLGVKLVLIGARDQSVVARLGTIVRHASDFTGGAMPFWLAWPLVVVFVIGMPFAIFVAFWLALRDEPA
jgi:hypothetical protein